MKTGMSYIRGARKGKVRVNKKVAEKYLITGSRKLPFSGSRIYNF